MPTALITGVLGQDGSYLAELLLEKGYHVVGMDNWASVSWFARVEHILDEMDLVQGSMNDQGFLLDLIEKYRPDEVYNLAAQSFVPASWAQVVQTGETTALGVARLLEAIRLGQPKARFFQASSSEVFGQAAESPQHEMTPFSPRTPYGVAKAYGHWITSNYRQSHGIFATSGILYNHESPRRGANFVTRKITHGAARIKLGMSKELRLGDLDARRDWGFAGDYVDAFWRMLQHDAPEDFIIGTGVTHSVRQLCEFAFGILNLDYQDYVVVDPRFVRPPEKVQLVANPAKIKRLLDWQPTVSFEQLVGMMVDADMRQLASEMG
ncbi:MAG: GDP-mannose 4,6-dehydratase [Chloroflexota bacterium]